MNNYYMYGIRLAEPILALIPRKQRRRGISADDKRHFAVTQIMNVFCSEATYMRPETVTDKRYVIQWNFAIRYQCYNVSGKENSYKHMNGGHRAKLAGKTMDQKDNRSRRINILTAFFFPDIFALRIITERDANIISAREMN